MLRQLLTSAINCPPSQKRPSYLLHTEERCILFRVGEAVEITSGMGLQANNARIVMWPSVSAV
jgi:hypothetical protein